MTGWPALVMSVICWGLWGFFAKVAQRNGVTSRAAMVFLALGYLVIVLAFCVTRIDWRHLGTLRAGMAAAMVAGLASAGANVFFLRSLDEIDVSIAAPVSSLYVGIVVILATGLLGEVLTPSKWLGVMLAMAAAALLAR